MKTCKICHEEKLLDQFPDRKSAKDGKRNECSACTKKIQRKKYEKRKGITVDDNKLQEIKKIARLKRAVKRIKRLIISPRKLAQMFGDIYYYSDRVCPKNHDSKRRTATGFCVECERIKTRKQTKSGYYSDRYIKKKDEICRKARNKYLNDPDYRKRRLETGKAWQENNKDKVNFIKQSYKSRRRSQEKQGDSTKEIYEWAKKQEKICYWCNACCKDKYHLDHYIPLAKNGTHTIDNLVISCPSCNLKKNAKDPFEFAKQIGRLF